MDDELITFEYHEDHVNFVISLPGSNEKIRLTVEPKMTLGDVLSMIKAESDSITEIKVCDKDDIRIANSTLFARLNGKFSMSIDDHRYRMNLTGIPMVEGESSVVSDTMEDLFTIHGYSKPTNYGEAMLLIGLLLAKLNVDEGILSAVYCRSVLEEFKKNFLLNYLPATTKKTAEVLREAYQKFYNDTLNAGSRHVRECLKINGTDFAENCLTMYKKASDLIHTVAELYKKHRTLDGIRKLLQDLPKSGEMERACLTAIVTLPSPSTAAVQGGPINFATYYGD